MKKGQIGVVFKGRFKKRSDNSVEDVSVAAGCTVKQIKFLKPDGTSVTNTASYTTDGTDGYIQYTTTAATELDKVGNWKWQMYRELGSSDTAHTDIQTFTVEGNL